MNSGRWYVMNRGKRLQNGILYVSGDKLHYEEARRVLIRHVEFSIQFAPPSQITRTDGCRLCQ